jgi:hypothetical protein
LILIDVSFVRLRIRAFGGFDVRFENRPRWPHVRQAIRAEVEKDYVKMPVNEIERHLAG